MNDRCTPATARRLKESGFPQPVPAFGQVWYDEKDNPFLIGNLDTPMWLPDVCVYAPTAPDILLELGSEYLLQIDKDGCICARQRSPKEVAKMIGFSEDNPAEAAALAWEAKQKAQ